MTPFEVLGLPASREVTDDDVRSAWRRLAAATHPDRPDGGDPAAFAAAAAAYTTLRTAAGRGDTLADPLDDGRDRGRLVPGLMVKLRVGRPARLAARLLGVAAAGFAAVAGTGWAPASLAVIAGALTWFFLTARSDLAVRRRE